MTFTIPHDLLSSKYAKGVLITGIFLFSFLIIVDYSAFFLSLRQRSVLPNNTQTIKNQRSENVYSAILQSSLFGVYVPSDLDEGQVKKSMLRITVAGILLANNTKESQVILRISNGQENTYKVGDAIPGGAIIKRITADSILIEKNGSLESLSLPKNDLTFEPIAKPLKKETQ